MDTSSLDYVTVNVFTQEKFTGNPLAIIKARQDATLTQEQKQTIAKEFNYSETTFVHARAEDISTWGGGGGHEWTVDIFTIDQELPFAGHPTIGTACHLLSALAAKDNKPLVSGAFNVKAGRIELEYDANTRRAKASIPHNVHVHQCLFGSIDLMKLQPKLGRLPKQSPVVSIVTGMTFVLLELDSLDTLTFVNPTSQVLQMRLDAGHEESFIGCYFYYALPPTGDGTVRLRTRMIESGVGEDAATGSAACTLACYLNIQHQQQSSVGKTTRYEIVQGVEMGRRSEIGVEVVTTASGGKIEKVMLSGSAVQVMEGKLSL